MPSISSRIAANPPPASSSPSPVLLQKPPLPVAAPTISSTLRSPLPNLVVTSSDSLRQFYSGGQIPQYRFSPVKPLAQNPVAPSTTTTVVQPAKSTSSSSGASASGSSGSGTTGFVPRWSSSTVIGNSHIDDGITSAGQVTVSEPLNVIGDIKSSTLYHSFVYSVAGAPLPSAATAGVGARGFVSDATVNTFGTAYTGGGSDNVPVYSDGTSWYIG